MGGFQGLVKNYNSFSKWCLQYSPIPVVVVRPTEKRLKKKMKRDADPTRQDYARILKDSGLKAHETDLGSKNSTFEISNDADAEAHAVAAALGLPAVFDPILKPANQPGSRMPMKAESGKSDVAVATQGSLSPDAAPISPGFVTKIPKSAQLDSPAISDNESSEGEDDEEGEFEAVAGHTLLGNDEVRPEIARKQKLHEMEVGEAAALAAGRKASLGSNDSSGSFPAAPPADDDDDEE